MKTINMKETTFEKRKVTSMLRVSNEIESYLNESDYLRNTLTHRLEAEFYSATLDEKEITYLLDKPTFLDWLLGRRKSKTIKVRVSAVLQTPPLRDGLMKIYELEKLD